MIKVFNTLGRQLQEFKPIEDKKVSFYHCGPTVYWTQHIGNLRGMMMGDLIRRSLVYLDYDVNYVRNYTDVGHLTSDADEGEDKMEKGAKREGKTPDEIAEKYIKIFENDIKEMNMWPPINKARVTEYISEIQKMVQVLLDKGAAYTTPKAIYFDVTKAKDYPAFSNKKLDDQEQIVGAGVGDVSDSAKKHPADFVVWFFKTGVHKNAIQNWESPFKQPGNTPDDEKVENGRGFPGWHIECSVIAEHFLGDTLDIHMGGVEHIPIHHPNEIAQSEAAHGVKFVNYWLHNEHLNVNDRKMSKSEGTGFSLVEIKEKGYDPMDLRYFFLQAHYRSKQNFTWEGLEAARIARLRLINHINDIASASNCIIKSEQEHIAIDKYKQEFTKALEDDFNIPKAFSIISEVLKSKETGDQKVDTILDFDRVFGLKIAEGVASADNVEPYDHIIIELLDSRQKARELKDWNRSDEIRDELKIKYGYEVLDTKEGQKLKKV